MTPRQRTALSLPCYRARDTINPRFKAMAGAWSTILSVNK
jgi:hypothetical protein